MFSQFAQNGFSDSIWLELWPMYESKLKKLDAVSSLTVARKRDSQIFMIFDKVKKLSLVSVARNSFNFVSDLKGKRVQNDVNHAI